MLSSARAEWKARQQDDGDLIFEEQMKAHQMQHGAEQRGVSLKKMCFLPVPRRTTIQQKRMMTI